MGDDGCTVGHKGKNNCSRDVLKQSASPSSDVDLIDRVAITSLSSFRGRQRLAARSSCRWLEQLFLALGRVYTVRCRRDNESHEQDRGVTQHRRQEPPLRGHGAFNCGQPRRRVVCQGLHFITVHCRTEKTLEDMAHRKSVPWRNHPRVYWEDSWPSPAQKEAAEDAMSYQQDEFHLFGR